ncbi:polysaccharide deacetylase family protein [Actinokineospora sp. NPDC004072]
MSVIRMIHGCAPPWEPGAQVVRNYVGEGALTRHLLARETPYGPLGEADALTVDDSTNGAARACVLAREAGSEVTLFVNPAQVERGRTYWFSLLDAILDQRQAATATFDGRVFDLSPGGPLRAFRLAAKSRLMALPEAEVDGLLDDLAAALGAAPVVVPEHAQTMSADTLKDLIGRGVAIGSHGWDHRDIASMTTGEVADDLRLALDWFHALGVHPIHYAVPYGLVPLPEAAVAAVDGMVLLANPALPADRLPPRHRNREPITGPLRDLAP